MMAFTIRILLFLSLVFYEVQGQGQVATLAKVNCPDNKQQVACWSIKYNNDYGEDVIYFYPIEVQDVYEGKIEGQANAKITAQGDVTDANAVISFVISIPEKTGEKRLEVNVNSNEVNLDPTMFQRLSQSEADALTRRELTDEVEQEQEISVKLGKRAVLPPGFELVVQPVMDRKFKKAQGAKAEATVKALLMNVEKAFLDKTLKSNFKITSNKVKEIDLELLADAASYVKIHQSPFDFNAISPTPNVFVFLTQTPADQIPNLGFKLELAIDGAICTQVQRRVGIMEYFATNLIAAEAMTRVIGNLAGIREDYILSGNQRLERKASDGSTCTNIKGFMDIPPNAQLWTKCSNEDLQKAFDEGKLNCLKKVTCPAKDDSALCPSMVRHIPNACEADCIKSSCPLSCNSICGRNVVEQGVAPKDCKCSDLTCPAKDQMAVCMDKKVSQCSVPMIKTFCPILCGSS